MTDTVTRLMGLADAFATAVAQQGEAHDRIARDALQDELTLLFITVDPAPEGFYQGSIADMITKEKRNEPT